MGLELLFKQGKGKIEAKNNLSGQQILLDGNQPQVRWIIMSVGREECRFLQYTLLITV